MNARTICLFSSMVFWVVIVFSIPRERLLRSNYSGQLFSGMRAFPHTWRKWLVHFLCPEYRELLWENQGTSGGIALHTLLHIWGPRRNSSESDRTEPYARPRVL